MRSSSTRPTRCRAVAYYGLKDGKVFDFISRTTPTRGKEVTILQEFFGNVGRFSDNKSILKDRIQNTNK